MDAVSEMDRYNQKYGEDEYPSEETPGPEAGSDDAADDAYFNVSVVGHILKDSGILQL